MTYTKEQIKDSVKRVNNFISTNKRTPKNVGIGKNTLQWSNWKKLSAITEAETRLKNWIKKNKAYPNYVDVLGIQVKPTVYKLIWTDLKLQIYDELYNHFVEKFGPVETVDDILRIFNNRGYGHYYNGKYTNKQTIDRIASKIGEKPNCTDSCQLVHRICSKVLEYKVTCVHVKCSSGGGHVFLKLSHPVHTKGKTIVRDPACVLSNNNKPITSVWCGNGKVIDINPQWYMKDLNK